jgi:DNA methylase
MQAGLAETTSSLRFGSSTAGLTMRCCLCSRKPPFHTSTILAAGKRGRRHRTNLWTYPTSPSGSATRKNLPDHGSEKPTAMWEDALIDLTNRGDIVLDPFLGSGSTLIAAENSGRVCYGVELDPLSIDVIIRRYEVVTRAIAVLAVSLTPAQQRDGAGNWNPASPGSFLVMAQDFHCLGNRADLLCWRGPGTGFRGSTSLIVQGACTC